MARYGCLIIGVVIALIVLVGIVYMWSGWLNRPVGHFAEVFTLTLALSHRGRGYCRKAERSCSAAFTLT